MLDQIAAWVAPIATIIAAMMTAGNFGARITGWGFVLFSVGSVCWVWSGVATGQTNLILSDGVLTVVNLVGCWRWLGRQRAIEDGGESAKSTSRRAAVPTLFTAGGLAGTPVVGCDGRVVGKAAEALIECASGKMSYLVVATTKLAGVDAQLRAVPFAMARFESDQIVLKFAGDRFDSLDQLKTGDWPGAV